jgi:hypothetical protein
MMALLQSGTRIYGTATIDGNATVGNITTSGVGGQFVGYHTGAIGANTANTGVFTSVTTTSAGQITGYHTGAIGANTANTGVFTSVTTTSAGQITGYHTGAIGANSANTGVFTSVTTTSAGQITGYHTGAIGANTANTGAFTTLTSSGQTNLANTAVTGLYTTNGLFWANGTSFSTGGGSTNAAGSNTFVQFNDGGTAFGGTAGLTFNKGSNALTVGGSITTVNAGQITGYHNGAIGANSANTGVFTSVTTTSAGQITGYITGAIGANTANTGVFTSVTTTSAGQISGYITGAIGANTANTGAFTTLTVTANANPILSITDSASTTYINKSLSIIAGTNNVWFTGNAGAGSYNPLVSSGDILFGHQGASVGNGVLTIAPWSNGSGGFRISTVANVTTINSTTIIPAANVTYNLGSATANWNNVYAVTFTGTSTTAKYADLAENYSSDKGLSPGDVVVFGGRKEVTTTTISHDTRVAGVVSTNPAYLMNSELENSYPIALTGRVPCKVLGPVSKGDVLVTSSIELAAEKIDNSKFMPGAILGKALESIQTAEVKLIEIVVGRF